MSNLPSLSSVGTRPALGYAGDDRTPGTPTVSYQNENATAIDAALPVARGTVTAPTNGVEMCKPWASDADDFLGISLRTVNKDATQAVQSVTYAQWDAVPIKKEGRTLVYLAEDVRGGDQVLVVTAGAAVQTTAFASSKGGVAGSGRVAIPWKYCGNGTLTSGSLVEIESYSASTGRTTT